MGFPLLPRIHLGPISHLFTVISTVWACTKEEKDWCVHLWKIHITLKFVRLGFSYRIKFISIIKMSHPFCQASLYCTVFFFLLILWCNYSIWVCCNHHIFLVSSIPITYCISPCIISLDILFSFWSVHCFNIIHSRMVSGMYTYWCVVCHSDYSILQVFQMLNISRLFNNCILHTFVVSKHKSISMW